jgi:hypothetical protein
LTIIFVTFLTSVVFYPNIFVGDVNKVLKDKMNLMRIEIVKPREYFAMCLIAKDDNLDIVEWIEYHRRMGCSKFYITDHNSTVSMFDTIRDYISSGLVEYSYADSKIKYRAQLHVYNDCLRKHNRKHNFIGFLDSDEFIVVVNKTQSIPDVLINYENYGGLTLNWKIFGSSGHLKRPSGGILPNYHKCFKNWHVKSIVNTQFVYQTGPDPHCFSYLKNKFAVDTSLTRIDGAYNINNTSPPPEHVFDVMYLNHYDVKSLEDFARKNVRGRADGSPPRVPTYFEDLDKKANISCGTLRMPQPN